MNRIGVDIACFRSLDKPNSCANCNNLTYTMHQGLNQCEVVNVSVWSTDQQYKVCNRWTAKQVPTEREKILAKLSKHEREVLGV